MFYTIYKVTNQINGKIYIGKHQTNDPNDWYLGSGKNLKRAFEKHGRSNFKKEILFVFDNEQEMNDKEIEIVNEDFVARKDTYNLCVGGQGGFSFVNNNRNLYPNPMKNPEIVKKCIETRRKNDTEERNQKLKLINQNNIQKAIKFNTGRKRPKQSKIMSEVNKKRWQNKDKMRNNLASYFLVISPTGEQIKTNRLQDFCRERNLEYGSLWNTSRTNKQVKKGRSKGWSCQKI